jgi:hypothetical protein
MKKLLALYCGLVVFMAVVAAQTPPRTTSGASSTTSPPTITVTGCITPDTMATPSTDSSPRFVLSSIDPQGGTGNPSASTATQPRSTLTGYALKPAADVNLGAHLNHKVQITGTLDTATSSATSAQPSSPNTSSAMPALKVTSVKMVSSTCP